MPDFRITPRAREDLKQIGRYTLELWGVQQRDTYLRNLDRRFAWLARRTRVSASIVPKSMRAITVFRRVSIWSFTFCGRAGLILSAFHIRTGIS